MYLPYTSLYLRHISAISPPDQARDHCAVLPSVLRLLHRTLSDYHAAFADKLSLSLEVLRLVIQAYFALLEVGFARTLTLTLTLTRTRTWTLTRIRTRTRTRTRTRSLARSPSPSRRTASCPPRSTTSAARTRRRGSRPRRPRLPPARERTVRAWWT